MDTDNSLSELPLLKQIEQYSIKCSKGHKKIASFILQNHVSASYMTASRLSKAVGVSESTVVRFAMELGFDGYPELQAEIRKTLKNKLTSVQRIEVASERLGDDVLTATLQSDIENLKNTLASTDKENFDAIVSMILYAKTVYIVGNRSSTSLANFMYFYFSLLFDKAKLVQSVSGSDIFEQMLNVGEGDLIIGISFPRYSKRTVDAMHYAKAQGAFAVAITDGDQSPIAQLADRVLYAKNEMASFVDSLVAPLSLINALISAVGQQKKKEISRTFEKLEKLWDEYSIYNKDK
jgi:DNA-binding MurR/RpiR family transcriptional regulator